MKTNKMHIFKLLVISLLIISGINSCAPKKTEKFIGLQLYSVRESMKADAAGTVAEVGKMGYKFVEPAGYGNGMFYGMVRVAFKGLVEANGMKLLSSHTGRPLPTEENWETTMAWWDECIAAHKAAGVSYIVQPSMGGNSYESLEMLKKTCDYFNLIGEKCNAQGIRFGYHNHAKEFGTLEGEIIYDFMLKNTDPKKVMFQIDIYWIIEGGKDPLDYFAKYPGRFELWHVKDEAEVGASGKIDFEPIFAKAELSGMKYYIVEVEKYNYTPLESVKMSLDYLLAADYVK